MSFKTFRSASAAWCLLAFSGIFPITQPEAVNADIIIESSDTNATAAAEQDTVIARSILAPYRVSPTPPWEVRQGRAVRA